jgi:hypothetical protein
MKIGSITPTTNVDACLLRFYAGADGMGSTLRSRQQWPKYGPYDPLETTRLL